MNYLVKENKNFVSEGNMPSCRNSLTKVTGCSFATKNEKTTLHKNTY